MPPKEYLEKLEEYVYDIQRAVTPRWLSRELEINLGAANQLLQDFYLAEKSKKRSKSITATYVVSGTPKSSDDGAELEVVLVPEEKLKAAEKKFKTCSSSVYCVFPSELTVSPASSIVNANCEHPLEPGQDYGRFDRIFSKDCKSIRTQSELEDLRRNAFKSGESLGFVKPTKAPSVCHQPKKSSSIAGAFANAAKKANLPSRTASDPGTRPETEHCEQVAEKPVETGSKKTVLPQKTKSGSLSAMFNRQAEKNKAAPPKKKEEKEVKEVETTSQKRKEPDEKKVSQKSPKKSSPPNKKAKIDNKKQKKEKPQRKRVVALMSDSSESEDEESEDKERRGEDAMEVEVEPVEEELKPDLVSSDEEEVVLATPKESKPSSSSTGGKHRVKKWVDKTFLDEDGFMVTEKRMEEIEEEDPVPEVKEESPEKVSKASPVKDSQSGNTKSDPDKENAKKEESGKGRGRPKKASSVSSGKQSSITSFFSKAK